MGKRKNDGKDIYRKKPFSGKIVKDLEREYLDLINGLKKIPKEPFNHLSNFLRDKFENNPDLKVIVLFKDSELRKRLIDLGNRGANLTVIDNALRIPDIPEYLINGHPIGLQLYEGELTPYWDDVIKKFKDKKRKFFKENRLIKNAVRKIISLRPITKRSDENEVCWVNTKLLEVQTALNEIMDIYLKMKAIEDGLIGYPAKWGLSIDKLIRQEFKPFTQKSHKIWKGRIIVLVQELRRIGYSKKQSYVITAELLNIAFPYVYRDADPDLVRQRYASSGSASI